MPQSRNTVRPSVNGNRVASAHIFRIGQKQPIDPLWQSLQPEHPKARHKPHKPKECGHSAVHHEEMRCACASLFCAGGSTSPMMQVALHQRRRQPKGSMPATYQHPPASAIQSRQIQRGVAQKYGPLTGALPARAWFHVAMARTAQPTQALNSGGRYPDRPPQGKSAKPARVKEVGIGYSPASQLSGRVLIVQSWHPFRAL